MRSSVVVSVVELQRQTEKENFGVVYDISKLCSCFFNTRFLHRKELTLNTICRPLHAHLLIT